MVASAVPSLLWRKKSLRAFFAFVSVDGLALALALALEFGLGATLGLGGAFLLEFFRPQAAFTGLLSSDTESNDALRFRPCGGRDKAFLPADFGEASKKFSCPEEEECCPGRGEGDESTVAEEGRFMLT